MNPNDKKFRRLPEARQRELLDDWRRNLRWKNGRDDEQRQATEECRAKLTPEQAASLGAYLCGCGGIGPSSPESIESRRIEAEREAERGK